MAEIANLQSVSDLTRPQFLAIDLLTLIPGVLSLIGGVVSIYWYSRMHPAKRVFRHKLFLYLILSDSARALLHISYPIITLDALRKYNYSSPFIARDTFPACDFFGYALNVTFLASDFTIAMTSLHTVLIIFNPHSTLKVYKIPKANSGFKAALKHFLLPGHAATDLTEFEKTSISNNNGYFETSTYIYKQEAGLYRFNLPILLFLIILLPIVLSSLVFIDGHRMINYISFCFPPPYPVWIRIVTEWGPRIFVIFFIVGCYFTIYIHIYFKLRKVTLEHNMLLEARSSGTDLNNLKFENIGKYSSEGKLKTFFYICHDVAMGIYYALFNISIDDDNSFMNSSSETSNKHQYLVDDFDYRDVIVSASHSPSPKKESDESNEPKTKDLLNQTQQALSLQIFLRTLEDFKLRKQQSLKSLRSIFIYPVSYVAIWLVPLAAQILRFCNKNVPFLLLCFVGFFQAIDGTVQTLIFAYRERPWRVFKERVTISTFTDDNSNNNNSNSNRFEGEGTEVSIGTIRPPFSPNTKLKDRRRSSVMIANSFDSSFVAGSSAIKESSALEGMAEIGEADKNKSDNRQSNKRIDYQELISDDGFNEQNFVNEASLSRANSTTTGGRGDEFEEDSEGLIDLMTMLKKSGIP